MKTSEIERMAKFHRAVAEQVDLSKPLPQTVVVEEEVNLICEQKRCNAVMVVKGG